MISHPTFLHFHFNFSCVIMQMLTIAILILVPTTGHVRTALTLTHASVLLATRAPTATSVSGCTRYFVQWRLYGCLQGGLYRQIITGECMLACTVRLCVHACVSEYAIVVLRVHVYVVCFVLLFKYTYLICK